MVAEHGASKYSNDKCRCDVCRAGFAAWQRGARARRAAALTADPTIVTHGIASTYENYRCRCRPCTTAHTVDARERRRS